MTPGRSLPRSIVIPLANPRTAADLVRIGAALLAEGGSLTALSIVEVPEGEQLSEGAKGVYHGELAKLIKPLLRHAIRYWELTLMMIERTGVQTDWSAQTRVDLDRTRALLMEQPHGPGVLPQGQIDAAAEARDKAADDSARKGQTAPTVP